VSATLQPHPPARCPAGIAKPRRPIRFDTRRLTQAAQDALRQRVVEAMQREGLTQAGAARRFGVSRSSVNHWIKVYRAAGERGLVSRRRGRRPKVVAASVSS
jgi:transposase-like protein